MKLWLSDHAKKRMFERGVSVAEVREILKKGQKWREDDAIHSRMHSVEVVYRVVDSDVYVITVYYR